MVHVKLPWELVEEILYRVHQPLSVIRFKIVCKQWNTFFESKWFVSNQLIHVRPQFILWNDFKVHSVSVTLDDDPKIEVRELSSEIELWDRGFPSCDGLLFYQGVSSSNKAVLMNPWLRQTRLIQYEKTNIDYGGIGYGSGGPEKDLKILEPCCCKTSENNDDISEEHQNVHIYKFETNEWKCKCIISDVRLMEPDLTVSLNGNLYWIHSKTQKYFIHGFDFSKEIFREVLCDLPWDQKSFPNLSTFRKDWFSVLKRFTETGSVEIWVTKDKINNIDDGENIMWMKFMSFSVPSFRMDLQNRDPPLYDFPSFFIDNGHRKSVVICCTDEDTNLCIFIVRGNAVKKFHIGFYARHRSYIPCLMPVPN